MKPAPSVAPDPAGTAGRWLWFAGVAGVVFAARLREIHLYSSETPFLDQWDAEAREILVPWLQGKLAWSDFFAPHNEHVPAWARLLAWLQALVLGRWDPQIQATLNAGLHGTFVGVMALWFRRTLPLFPAFLLTALAVVLTSLPFGWENITWGFQSHTPLALLFVFLHVHGSFTHSPGSARWWLAQVAGLAAFFTYGSMWAAPAAVLLTALWTAAPGRRRWIAATVLTVAGLALLLWARTRQDPATTLTLVAHSPQEFLAAFLLQLGWPAAWPGSCALLCLPSLLLALQLRRKAPAENFDRIVLALAVWSVAQAAAFAFARGGNYIGFVSRYGDLLALGLVANGVALWRLWHGSRAWRAALIGVLALGWIGLLAPGLVQISTRGHTQYFHEHSEQWALVRREAVWRYLSSKDLGALSTLEVRQSLYPDPEVVAQVLDQPGLAALLPASLRPDETPVRGDFFSSADARIRSLWGTFAATAVLLLLLALVLARRDAAPPAPTPALGVGPDPWSWPILAALALASGALIFLWPKPLEFSPEKRWLALLNPPGTREVSFRFTTTTTYPDARLIGGAALMPGDFRNRFFGTHVDGPDFTGSAQSSVFPLSSPWLIIPYAGFPASEGNGIYLRIADAHGTVLKEWACPGPNVTDIDFWAVDARGFTGSSASILLVDGRTDNEGWVAVAPPQPATGPERAEADRRDRSSEPTRYGQASLGILAMVALVLCIFTALTARRRKA